MSFYMILLLGIGVSADAFAVAICKGLAMKKFSLKKALTIGLFFGGFQGLMTFLGWALASNFSNLLESIDHWIAFILLVLLGVNMLIGAFKKSDSEQCDCEEILSLKELFILSIATSIDALAVGISLAFNGTPILIPAVVIGICTFSFSTIAVYIGHKFGSIFQKYAEISGGIILMLIGVKILLDHTILA